MKLFAALSVIFFLFISCAPHKEIVQPSKGHSAVQHPIPEKIPFPFTPAKKFQQILDCSEKTDQLFNRSGMEVLPFSRLAFFDIDNDGSDELISGSKDGLLRLYKKTESGEVQQWRSVANYFEGISAGAFSSPAIGDIDLDGKPEIILGTGGFSSDSGRVLIFRNNGTTESPKWDKVDMPLIDVGDDATPALIDVDGDAKKDLIIGNSTGVLSFYKNTTKKGIISFKKIPGYFSGINIGMYAMPAAVYSRDRFIIIAGNSMGKLYLIEKQNNGKSGWVKVPLNISLSSFAAPAFVKSDKGSFYDLVVSDGSGDNHYFKNIKTEYREWEENPTPFAERIMPGPVSTPTVTDFKGKIAMVIGNIHGELKLYSYAAVSGKFHWIEEKDFLKGIKLSGYSRGALVTWQGKYLIVTGQQDGPVRAFLNKGSADKPLWEEQKNFFRGVPKIMHASPAIFDLDQDGMWELIVGDVGGYITGYKYESSSDGTPFWKKIEQSFSSVKVDRYASPALAREGEKIYLFVGQQDGMVKSFTASSRISGMPVFNKDDSLKGIQVNNHSSPSAYAKDGVIELSVGDYSGNLKHFACRESAVEVK